MAFEKGKSGNPAGTRGPKSEKAFTEALRIVSKREGTGTDRRTQLMKLAEQLFKCAIEDKQGWAFAQIADRLEGKAIQQVDVSVIDNRDISEISDAELTAMLKDRVVHAPLDDKPRPAEQKLN